MRTLITSFLFALSIASCNGQTNQAVKDQQDAYKALEDMTKKGLKPTTEGGYTMTAFIDGKPWTATGMYPIAMTSRIIGIYKDGQISFPVPNMTAGTKRTFSDHYAVDFSPVGSPDFWGGRAGEIEITKVADGWAEGKFFFTATKRGSDKKIEVTHAFFRVAVKNK